MIKKIQKDRRPKFITKYTTVVDNEEIVLPYVNNNDYKGTIDWGDGTVTKCGELIDHTHTYSTSGDYIVSIDGWYDTFRYNSNNNSKDNLREIIQYGCLNAIGGDLNIDNCDITATDRIILTSGYSLFSIPSLVYNTSINNLDTTSLSSAKYMFRDATLFNQPLDLWEVSNVVDMSYMFSNCSIFNQPLNSWDVSSLTNTLLMFSGCTNFNQPLDSWDVSSAINTKLMFHRCSNFDQPLNSWDVSSVTDMMQMFYECSNFNQPLDSWDTSSVTTMRYMFRDALKFDQPLDSWDYSSVTQISNFMEYKSPSNYSDTYYDDLLIKWDNPVGGLVFANMVDVNIGMGSIIHTADGCEARDSLISKGFIITDGGQYAPIESDLFKTVYTTTTAEEDVIIPLVLGKNYDFRYRIGGQHCWYSCTSDTLTINIPIAGDHTIDFDHKFGGLPEWRQANSGDKTKIKDVTQWGNNIWDGNGLSFYGCSNLIGTATDIPDLSMVDNLVYMFFNCPVFNNPMDSWDVSSVTTVQGMFRNASLFNQALDSWDTSSVTTMYSLFWGCHNFDQPLNSWDVSSVTITGSMFRDCDDFNQPLDSWDTSSVTTMRHMFKSANAFNQPLDSWDYSSVTQISNFMDGKTSLDYNASFYDDLLIKWDNSVGGLVFANMVDINIGMSSIKYTIAGATAHASLVSKGFTITDGGQV